MLNINPSFLPAVSENFSEVNCASLVKAWQACLNQPTITDAILDRIVAKAHGIDLKGGRPPKKLV